MLRAVVGTGRSGRSCFRRSTTLLWSPSLLFRPPVVGRTCSRPWSSIAVAGVSGVGTVASSSSSASCRSDVNDERSDVVVKTLPKETSMSKESSFFARRWLELWYHSWLLLVRGAEIALRLSPLAVLCPLAVLESRWTGSRSNEEEEEEEKDGYWEKRAWRYALHTLQSLGPAFVKLAQWASARRDLLSPYHCRRLGRLHDRAPSPSSSWRDAHRTLARALGDDYFERGLRLSEGSPVIGSGAAASVRRGYLRGRGLVAVKVRHPDLARNTERDARLVVAAARTLDAVLPADLAAAARLPEAARRFADHLRRQVDLTVEARNLETFRRNFSDVEGVRFPEPVADWTTPEVLVEELVADAEPVSRYLDHDHDDHDDHDDRRRERRRSRLVAAPFLNAFMRMVFVDNFLHGDLHPGNVLVKRRANGHELWFLDAGIVTELSPRRARDLRDLFRAVVENDGDRVGRLMVERSDRPVDPDAPNVDRFAAGTASLVDEFHRRHTSSRLALGRVRVGDLLARVLDLCRTHGVSLDPAMTDTVISVLVCEGLGRSLDPDTDLVRYALPFLLLRSGNDGNGGNDGNDGNGRGEGTATGTETVEIDDDDDNDATTVRNH